MLLCLTQILKIKEDGKGAKNIEPNEIGLFGEMAASNGRIVRTGP